MALTVHTRAHTTHTPSSQHTQQHSEMANTQTALSEFIAVLTATVDEFPVEFKEKNTETVATTEELLTGAILQSDAEAVRIRVTNVDFRFGTKASKKGNAKICKRSAINKSTYVDFLHNATGESKDDLMKLTVHQSKKNEGAPYLIQKTVDALLADKATLSKTTSKQDKAAANEAFEKHAAKVAKMSENLSGGSGSVSKGGASKDTDDASTKPTATKKAPATTKVVASRKVKPVQIEEVPSDEEDTDMFTPEQLRAAARLLRAA